MPRTAAVLLLLLGASALACGSAEAGPLVRSSVDGIEFTFLDTLPKGPRPQPDGNCASSVIDPTTSAGKAVAAKGWAVTAEAEFGNMDVVSFGGAFASGTSGSCEITQGNIAVFHGKSLLAIAYAGKKSADTIGSVVPLEGGNLRIWSGGYLSQPVADLNLSDRGSTLEIVPLADEESVCDGAATIPNIYNMPIDKAQKSLADAGWTPVPQTEEVFFDRETEMREGGLAELVACSGTGFGYCRFAYEGDAGTLDVTTVGEEDPPEVAGYAVTCE